MPPPIPRVSAETAAENIADLPDGIYYLEVTTMGTRPFGLAVPVREGGHHFEFLGKMCVIWPCPRETDHGR
jgi:hypothetical protein